MFIRATLAALAAVTLAACGEQSADQTGAPASNAETAPALSPAAEAGRAKFGPCAVCHSVRQDDNARVGPSLYGVYGRKAGTLDGFAFSKALIDSEIVWNDETLDGYIENPQSFIRGNRMAFAGERDPEARAAIIEYLKTLKPADD